MNNQSLILLVEDDADFRGSMAEVLKAAGFDIALASTGEEGVKKAGELMPALILMDIRMPGIGGVEAALSIKRNEATKNLKIAFLTNIAEPWPVLVGDNAEIAKELGMEDFIVKTDNPEKIMEKIRGLLGRAS